MSDWVPVGKVVKLQVQRDQLRADGVYRLDPLAEVSVLRLTTDGPIGFDGRSWVVDRHHRAHPAAKHHDPNRALSIGFTSHYESIWEQFTPIPLGTAGENVIVECDRVVSHSQLSDGIRIGDTDVSLVIPTASVAEPCVPFTRLVTGRSSASAAELAEDRDCLRRGIRGFVMALDGADNFDVLPGAPVSIRPG